MAAFTSVAGLIFIIIAVWLFVVGLYWVVFAGRATDSSGDSNAKVSKGERQGALATAVIQMIVGVVLGVWGVILIIPQDRVNSLGQAGRVLRFGGVSYPAQGGSVPMASASPMMGGVSPTVVTSM